MVLVDKKILLGGVAMIVVGVAMTAYLSSIMPIGTYGMTEEEATILILEQRENEDIRFLFNILAGVGFLLVLVSFGARRKRRDGTVKKEKRPTQKQ